MDFLGLRVSPAAPKYRHFSTPTESIPESQVPDVLHKTGFPKLGAQLEAFIGGHTGMLEYIRIYRNMARVVHGIKNMRIRTRT